MAAPMENYVEVSERIEKFYEKFPEGSLRCKEIRTIELGGESFLVYVAQAFRTPNDEAPAEGAAWEPVPGKTNFTRDSELMNAETSAWGRAIAALGFEVKRGIASGNEVRNRQGNGGGSDRAASEKQRNYSAQLVEKAGFTEDQLAAIRKATSDGGKLTSQGASFLIENLKDGTAEGRTAVLEKAGWSDVPTDAPDETDFQPDGKTAPDDDLPPF